MGGYLVVWFGWLVGLAWLGLIEGWMVGWLVGWLVGLIGLVGWMDGYMV